MFKKMTRVDLFLIREVLKTINLSKLKPILLMIEASHLDMADRNEIISYLQLENYKILYDNKINIIFER